MGQFVKLTARDGTEVWVNLENVGIMRIVPGIGTIIRTPGDVEGVAVMEDVQTIFNAPRTKL